MAAAYKQSNSSAVPNFVTTRRYQSKTRVFEKPQREIEFDRRRADSKTALSA
jgi:hypothetical protein